MSRFEKYELITDLIALLALGFLTVYAINNIQSHDIQWTICSLLGTLSFAYATSAVKARHDK